MKVFYFLNGFEEKDYKYFLDKMSLINNINDIDNIIEKYYYKIGLNNKGKTYSAYFIESLMFLKNFLNKGYGNLDDIVWVRGDNFLIYNENIYYYETGTGYWNLLDGKNWFVTCRDNWGDPFFMYLYKLQKINKNYRLIKPDYIVDWNYRDKIYFTSKLIKNRNKYIGNVVIPLLVTINSEVIKSLITFVKKNIGNEVIIKNNFGVMGQSVRAIKADKYLNDELLIEDLKKNFYSYHVGNFTASYFTPYYGIEKEYRIYYTYHDKKTKIYSIKNRENEVKGGGEIFEKKDITYSSVDTKWLYCDIDDFIKYDKEIFDIIGKIVKKLGLNTGVLELCKTKDGKIRFLEVNPLGGTLMYPGKDQENMKTFYTNIWKNVIN